MEQKNSWHKSVMGLAVVGTAIISLLILAPDAGAKSSKRSKSSKALPRAVARAPVCEVSLHPKITKVSPDPVRPGQKITIKGTNFGSKACFKKLSFGRYKAKSFKYVNDTTLEAKVPGLKAGLTPVNIMTAGGTSEYILLVEKGKRVKKARKAKRSKKAKKSRKAKRRRSR